MKNMVKKGISLLLAAAVVVSGAFVPVTTYAADTENEAPVIAPPHNVGFEVYVNNEGIENLVVYWDPVEGSEGYNINYTFEYNDADRKFEFCHVNADQTSVMIELPTEEDYGSIMVFVSATKGGVAGSDTEGSITKKEVDDQMEAAHTAYDARNALTKKARALAKSDKKKYETLSISCIFKDINGDNVPELLYFRHFNRAEVLVYRYDALKNTAKLVKTDAGEKTLGGVSDIRVPKSGKGIVVKVSGSAYSGAVITYTLTKAGKLKTGTKYVYDYSKKKYTKNGKKITKAKLDKYLDSYYALDSIGQNTVLYE